MAHQISKRTKRIIELLIEQDTYVSGNWIAKQLGVSKRTVLREMNEVERHVKENGAVLERIPGKGVRLKVSDENLNDFLLGIGGTAVEEYFNPEERQRYLLIELISTKETQKLYYFASKLKISEATVSHDFDRIEGWLEKRHLKLIRKPGYGVKVEGHERDIRKTIVELVYDNFSRDELMTFLRRQFSSSVHASTRSDIKKRLLNIIGDSTLNGIETAIEKSSVLSKYQIADNAYVALVVHLSLAVQRLMEGDEIRFDAILLEELKESPEFEMAQKIIDAVSDILKLTIPIDEVGYVTMHIQGAKFRSITDQDTAFRIHDYEIIHLAEQLVQIMERKAGMILSDNKRLLTDLVNHMGPAFTRIRMGMVIRNPLLGQIQSQYMTYYNWTKEAAEIIEQRLGNKIPEDEIGYLTMHFGAAIESSMKKKDLIWRVIIACSTGIGSSKLLESRVRKLYKNIRIVSIRSTIDIEKAIEEENVDFIISTVNLAQTMVPTVVVSPLLLDEDAQKIEGTMAEVIPKQIDNSTTDGYRLVDKLARIKQVAHAGEVLLKNIFFLISQADTTEALVGEIVSEISPHEAGTLVRDFLKREEYGRTQIAGGAGTLLHCRSGGVKEIQLGFVKTDKGCIGYDFALVMVVPENVPSGAREILGSLTQKISESEDWIMAIARGNIKMTYTYLEQVIDEEVRATLKVLEDKNE